MIFILLTIVYCLISLVTPLSSYAAFFSYVCIFALFNGFVQKEGRKAVNFRSAKEIYNEVGFRHTILSTIGYLIMFINYMINDPVEMQKYEIIPVIIIAIITFRFFTWTASYSFEKLFIKA